MSKNSQYYQLEGVRCARCIHAIESALKSHAEIITARVNLSTNRLLIEWEGEEERAQTYAQEVSDLGYPATPFETQKKETSESSFLLRCMAIAGFSMGNIMLISVTLWSSDQEVMGLATRELLHWISAAIALPTIAYAGRPFFRSALSVLTQRRTNMDVPISLALLLASGMSIAETLHHGEHVYFDSAVMLLFFLLIGRYLDARARGKARENAQSLLAMMQGYATIIEGETSRTVPINALEAGMTIRIAVGEKIPTDAILIEGETELDTSLVTGETLPRAAQAGDLLYGGTMNLGAPITCRIEKASEDSLLADIIRLMEQAEQGRARYVRLADRAAQLYTPVVHSLAAAAFLGWIFLGGAPWQEALLIAITTLIITCPCALGLAVPVVQVLASSWLMKRGILLKSGDALERLATITTAVFDKTGTLTMGRPTLVKEPEGDQQVDAALSPRSGSPLRGQEAEQGQLETISASLAQHSKHSYSQAITAAHKGTLVTMTDIREVAGEGVYGTYNGEEYHLGKHRSENAKNAANVALYRGEELLESFEFTDSLRPDAHEVMRELSDADIKTHLLSGDQETTVQAVAQKLGMTYHHAAMLPAEKTETITQLQQQGARVMMVGDGLNDAPSLAKADISLSPASGMDITQNSADIVFQGVSLSAVTRAWRMAHHSTKLVKHNFALAVIYNCIAIPLAVAGYVTPLVAALAMSCSSLLVIANSFRINRLEA